jgi:hypothetical protein
MKQHNVCLPLPYQPRHSFAVFQTGLQFAVVYIEHFCFYAQYPGTLLHFGPASGGKGAACFFEVPDVAIGHGDKFNLVTTRRPQGGYPACF